MLMVVRIDTFIVLWLAMSIHGAFKSNSLTRCYLGSPAFSVLALVQGIGVQNTRQLDLRLDSSVLLS